jgi:hypothetical protein
MVENQRNAVNREVTRRTKAEIESSTERPTALAVDPDAIPIILRDQDQWVDWEYNWRGTVGRPSPGGRAHLCEWLWASLVCLWACSLCS